MDTRLKDYVVMKAVANTNGKRGRSSLLKLLRGSQGASISKMAADFDLFFIWGVFTGFTMEDINEIFDNLLLKGLIYSKDVKAGNYSYPMLYITNEGRSLLSALEGTELPRLVEYKEQWYDTQVHQEITDKGKLLDDFLRSLISFISHVNDNHSSEADFTEIIEGFEISYEDKTRLEKFFYRRTLEKFKDRWRTRAIFDITAFDITRDLRIFLASMPEAEALIFRYHFKLKDQHYKPLDDIARYYLIPENEAVGITKRAISRFSQSGCQERFVIIRDISGYIDELADKTGVSSLQLTKNTAQVTYDMYSKGMSIPDIARERCLAVSTIYSHFIKLIPEYNIELYSVIPKDRVLSIVEASEGLEDSLKAIKDKLPPGYSYGEIKLVLAIQNGLEIDN